jgi:hypothetical protein
MLDAAFEGRGIGEFKETTHCGGGGGGRRACDIIKIVNVMCGGGDDLRRNDGEESWVGRFPPQVATPPSILLSHFLSLFLFPTSLFF